MKNIMDYLDWRGDLTFAQSPLNEVDCYILCKLGSPDFTQIIPRNGGVSITTAVEKYFEERGENAQKLGVLISPQVVPMIRRLPSLPRFQGLMLRDFVNSIDHERGKQFSALTIELPDGARFVTFRGTDDTLVAWKEDLMFSVEEEVPAQEDAKAYLLSEALRAPGTLLVGGHSKGGNLAVYAAMRLPEAMLGRLKAVYNFDGPGFRESPFERPEYQRIKPKLHTVVSQYTIVGTLLWNEKDQEIVRADRAGMVAHDGFHWEVRGTRFARCEELSLSSRSFASAMSEIEAQMSFEERRAFIASLFTVLESTGAVTLTDLTEQSLRQAAAMAQTLVKDGRVRGFLLSLLNQMLRVTVSNVSGPVRGRLRMFRRGGKRKAVQEGEPADALQNPAVADEQDKPDESDAPAVPQTLENPQECGANGAPTAEEETEH